MKTFHFDQLTTYLVQAPPYAIAYISACTIAVSIPPFIPMRRMLSQLHSGRLAGSKNHSGT